MIDGEPVFQIVRQYRTVDDVETVARVCMISEEAVEEAIEFFQKYPNEVYRDIVKRQLYHFAEKAQQRKDALALFLDDCDDCGEGQYTWKEATVTEENLLAPKLYKLKCHNCGFEPN